MLEPLEPRQLLNGQSPSVLGVRISGSAWPDAALADAVLAEHVPADSGLVGYAIPGDVQGQLRTLPWTNLDRVQIEFDRDAIVARDDLTVHGVAVPAYSVAGFAYNPASHAATWTLAAPIAADKLLLILSDQVRAAADDAPLDGDWPTGADNYPSGDGIAGGSFLFRLNVLPGDVNQDGIVSRADIAWDLPNQFASVADDNYNPLHDTSGDGVVNLLDAAAIRDRFAATLPAAEPLGAATIAEISPADGEEMVNVARETIVRFSAPIVPDTITADAFYLIASGERVSGTIRVSATERFATFFYSSPLPASTEVRVVVDGNLVTDRDGLLLDADGDGQPGGVATADFRTLPLTRIPGTRVWGYVYDSYNKNPDGSDIPVVGATIRVDAFPAANAVTDATGRFELIDMPAPEFFVHVDGTTAITAPPGTIYPSVGKPFHSVPGQSVQLNMLGTPFNIYLPPMAMGDVVPLNPTQDTPVGFGPAGKAELATMFPNIPPETWDLMQVTYPAGSAIDEQGNPATSAITIPVPPNRIPAPLPPGLNPKLVISIQAPGATNFDTPAPITFPNLENLAPGEKSLIFSFNHDAGRWDVIGTGTVSADGSAIVADPGVGVVAPGWHFGL